jgi:hypothetical protein
MQKTTKGQRKSQNGSVFPTHHLILRMEFSKLFIALNSLKFRVEKVPQTLFKVIYLKKCTIPWLAAV